MKGEIRNYSKTKLSVVMPVYQTCEIYLREAIESVLGQTYLDFEFLIVNDSPQDNLRLEQIVASYNDNRIIWVPCKVNGGIAIASNIGIDLAQGSFIAIIDHDDICIPTRFEQQVRFLTKNPEIGFVGGQAEAFYPDNSSVRLDYLTSSTMKELKQSFFDGVPFLNPSVMFRTSALNTLRYNSHYKVCADYDLFARLVFAKNIMATNLPEVILRYRFHDTNTSLNQYLLAEEETNEIQRWILQHDNVLIK
ncbi:MAG: glycosyltransferase [Burkholderiales bacterium]|nr:glycosyltransferase [Burkholderiales bacterium]